MAPAAALTAVPFSSQCKTDASVERVNQLVAALLKERKKRRLAQERFQHSFHHSPIAMAIVAPDGMFVEVSDKLCSLLGYTREELLELNFQKVTRDADIEPDVELVRSMLAGEIHSYKMAKAYIHKKGHEVWVGLYVTLIKNVSGMPIYFVSQIVAEDTANEVLNFISGAKNE